MKTIERKVKKKMKIIDGSFGEGGGQILRSTLALAMCTGTPVRIENIRAGRKKSGLLRQHLACVRASKMISDAKVTGDKLGSSTVEFTPGVIQSGSYDFAIGSAGSTNLLFQTVLPALTMAEGESTVSFSGGTHNDFSPSFDFIKHSFIPMMKALGIDINAELQSYGFAPTGGGKWTATIKPNKQLIKLDITTAGKFETKKAIVTQSGVSKNVAERELARIKKKLQWADNDLHINQVQSIGSGNIVSLRVANDEFCEVVEFVGAKNLSAERVAGKAIAAMKRYLQSGAVVGEHLCDQLLLPLSLGNGGRFTTIKPSLHTETNIQVIQQFVNCDIRVKQMDDDCFEIVVEK